MLPAVRLEGRRALVTGGASGIGAAVAARLAAEGAEVWVGDIDVEGAERVAGEISGHAVALDVTSREAAQAAVEAAGGTLDILVNNAGTDEFGFFVYTSPEQWPLFAGLLAGFTGQETPANQGVSRSQPLRGSRLAGYQPHSGCLRVFVPG